MKTFQILKSWYLQKVMLLMITSLIFHVSGAFSVAILQSKYRSSRPELFLEISKKFHISQENTCAKVSLSIKLQA